jgi:hypothetical protein
LKASNYFILEAFSSRIAYLASPFAFSKAASAFDYEASTLPVEANDLAFGLLALASPPAAAPDEPISPIAFPAAIIPDVKGGIATGSVVSARDF